jgi:hypothetical protein
MIQGESIATGYQKIPYHMVLDVKYDLIHKEILAIGGYWKINKKEDICRSCTNGYCKNWIF